jgi:hypothetical protein
MRSRVIRFLLASDGDPRQAVRLRSFLLASATYTVCAPLLGLAYGIPRWSSAPWWLRPTSGSTSCSAPA